MDDKKSITRITDSLKALGDPTRFQLLKVIARTGNNICVNAITNRMEITQPTVSQHLKVLKNAGIVEATRSGNQVHYTINTESILELAESISSLAKISKINCTPAECGTNKKPG